MKKMERTKKVNRLDLLVCFQFFFVFSYTLNHTRIGQAREPINAILPMFINEAHWKRVEVLIEPMLGYFFTLDPLGFHPAQLLALCV